MNDKKAASTGLGVGYVSLMILFAVICLTVLAVLSLQAAGSNEILNDKSTDFSREYYAADSSAKRTLMQLDGAAYEAAQSGFFDDAFPYLCEDIEGVEYRKVPEGYSVSWSEPLNSRLSLSVTAVFMSSPVSERYRIETWKTVSADTVSEEDDLGVWDGTTFN